MISKGEMRNSKPEEERKIWKGQTFESRLFYYSNSMTVLYPDFVNALKEIKRRRNRSIASNTSNGLFLCATSGSGKSHFIRYLHQLWPQEHSSETSIIPIASFTVPSKPTEKSMSEALLRTIGDPAFKSGSAEHKIFRAFTLIEKASVKVICIDNTQDITERRKQKGVTLIGGWVRRLYDGANCAIILFGTPEGIPVIESDKQIERRFKSRMHIRNFSLADKSSETTYLRFLKKLDEKLPLAECSHLDNVKTASKIFAASRGVQGIIFMIVSEAIESAVTNHRERITEADLHVGYRRVFMESEFSFNPFSES